MFSRFIDNFMHNTFASNAYTSVLCWVVQTQQYQFDRLVRKILHSFGLDSADECFKRETDWVYCKLVLSNQIYKEKKNF